MNCCNKPPYCAWCHERAVKEEELKRAAEAIAQCIEGPFNNQKANWIDCGLSKNENGKNNT